MTLRKAFAFRVRNKHSPAKRERKLTIATHPPASFRIVAVLGLLWNLYGVYEYLAAVGIFGAADPAAGADTAADLTPIWVTAAFSIAVFAGALGALLLLLLKRWATPLLVLSLVAVLVWDVWVFFLAGAADVSEEAGYVVPILVTVVAVLLVWVANTGAKRGWLR